MGVLQSGAYLDGPIIGLQQDPQRSHSIRDMAEYYAETIRTLHPDGPYHLLGWSLGGAVAHQVGVELSRQGGVVQRLIALDPSPLDAPVVDQVSESDVLEVIHAQGFVRPSRQLIKILTSNLNTNMVLPSQHVPEVFDGDMIIFSARPGTDDSALRQSWRPYVAGNITEYPVDCAHAQMLTPQSLKLFGQQIKTVLTN